MSQFRAAIFPVTPYQQNCSILWCEATKKGAIIDPGGEVGRLLAAVAENGITVEKIFLTHGHLDHASGANELRRRTGVPIEGPHQDDTFLLEALEENRKTRGFEKAEACTPDRFLNDGDTVSFGEATLQVVHCPGHTPGHVVFYDTEAKIAFCGDVLFKGSIGRTDFPRGNYMTLIASITEKLWPLGNDMRFVPGHGPMSSFGDERRSNPFVSDGALRNPF
ncbi:glyoxylase-like metal-dependent hydrolase (beta-lactamase superfamily II) [Rhizomicrobium palustre]|uniref:Glyoxylase-like metal-dependent hydrolase (Beta-lactamase superfamily II) n=1 Tax=Rhizomicrobium palustre TaxID=189966 RepID=A0A846MZY5_9PROT|nr:MBL fold metallo-hydrolase [Rhizomicrobium palustre]NIK88497.1 glyoxylase-like metal-dependent hydrolase (beta-lactamase superfamily II) [Rhizomicrobium palustre]